MGKSISMGTKCSRSTMGKVVLLEFLVRKVSSEASEVLVSYKAVQLMKDHLFHCGCNAFNTAPFQRTHFSLYTAIREAVLPPGAVKFDIRAVCHY